MPLQIRSATKDHERGDVAAARWNSSGYLPGRPIRASLHWGKPQIQVSKIAGQLHFRNCSVVDLKGQLSNPVQRRLADAVIDDLVTRYEAGSTIEVLASTFGIHRTTVMAHLERPGVPRRGPRKLTDEMVAEAAHRCTSGETLAEIATKLGIAPSTLTRELQLAGIAIRRRGRRPSD